MFDLEGLEIERDPFPHLILDDCLPRQQFEDLCAEFPGAETTEAFKVVMGGRRRLCSDEAEFYTFLETHPAWAAFWQNINSRNFTQNVLQIFSSDIQDYGGFLSDDWRFDADAGRDKIKKSLSSRISKAARKLKRNFPSITKNTNKPHKLSIEFDISAAHEGYSIAPHQDLPWKIVVFLVYFSDLQQLGGEGGELGIHKLSEEIPIDKHVRKPDPDKTICVKKISPKPNRMVMFLSTKNSYHSVPLVKGTSGPRNFIYGGIGTDQPSFW